MQVTQEQYKLTILRSHDGELLDNIFTVFVTVVVTFNTFLMGTQLDIKVILGVIKRPIGPVIAFFCQYLLMPVVRTRLALVMSVCNRKLLQLRTRVINLF